MTRTIHGHKVQATPHDGLAGYWRVHADGVFCGLIERDAANQWHTLPAAQVGRQSPPRCYSPTCELALSTLVAEVFPC